MEPLVLKEIRVQKVQLVLTGKRAPMVLLVLRVLLGLLGLKVTKETSELQEKRGSKVLQELLVLKD
jgi:hypothetical protein